MDGSFPRVACTCLAPPEFLSRVDSGWRTTALLRSPLLSRSVGFQSGEDRYFFIVCWRCFACSKCDVKIGPALSSKLFNSAFLVFGIRVLVTTPITASW